MRSMTYLNVKNSKPYKTIQLKGGQGIHVSDFIKQLKDVNEVYPHNRVVSCKIYYPYMIPEGFVIDTLEELIEKLQSTCLKSREIIKVEIAFQEKKQEKIIK